MAQSPSLTGYKVLAAAMESEYEIKKSRFIAQAGLAEDRQQAMELLRQAQLKYPDARHHCWAYLIGDPQSPAAVAMSDDGEPAGTAGKPIITVLQHKGVGDIMLVVSRYFGGVKLGAGGLVRAYSSAAQQVMVNLSLNEKIPLTCCNVSGGYELEQPLRHWLFQHSGQLTHLEYGIAPQVEAEQKAGRLNSGIHCQIEISDHSLPELHSFIAAWGASISIA